MLKKAPVTPAQPRRAVTLALFSLRLETHRMAFEERACLQARGGRVRKSRFASSLAAASLNGLFEHPPEQAPLIFCLHSVYRASGIGA